jgi:tRNA pseudouridine38-40 synthase
MMSASRMEAPLFQTRRFRVDLAYDGRPFSGWQSQPSGDSVQDAIESALASICPEVTSVQGSGRTDAGVSALGQVAHFDAPAGWRMSGDAWQRALNSHLPPTIRAIACGEVDPAFHARFSALEKTYDYEIVTGEVLPPLRHGLAWHQRGLGPAGELEAILARYTGTHDFRAFSAKRHDGYDDLRNTMRDIVEASLRPADGVEGYVLRFRGNGFLYKMVRFLVGTAVYVLRGRISLADLDDLLAGESHADRAPYCAPASGLTLVAVRYPDTLESCPARTANHDD